MDGNVLRVIMRILNCYDNIDEKQTKENVKEILLSILPLNSGDFNEGIMELGETICLPNAIPKCEKCPLSKNCLAYKKNTIMQLPIRSKKKEKKREYHTVFLMIYDSYIAIEKRNEVGLLHNLWQFPNLEGKISSKKIKELFPKEKIEKANSYQHIFTHKIWENQVFIIYCQEKDERYTWVTLEQISTHFAIPTAFMPVINIYKSQLL